MVGDWVAPNLLGQGYLFVHVAGVSACATAQFVGLRRMQAEA